MKPQGRTCLVVLIGLTALAVLTYLPALSQPFIADDYGNIPLARSYGPFSDWQALARDPVHKYRPVFLVLTYWIDHFFGPNPPAFYTAGIALHVLITWLVFALGAWRAIGWPVAAVSAAFFAIYEGHQEAVMWYSAAYELLLALFGLACLVLWIRWLQSGRLWYYAGACTCFLLALASKESAVIIVPLLLLPVFTECGNSKRGLLGMVPFAALALFYVFWLFGGAHHPRLDDGSFSLQAPFLTTWLNSYWRLFWIWGLLSLLAIFVWKARQWRTLLALAGVWIGLTLLPYSFLTYMTRVPSRHTYLASVGLAWVVAAGVMAFRERFRERRRWVVFAVAALILIHNIGYLWTRKRAQYLERAAATEALIHLAKRVDTPIYVHRFPYPLVVAQGAVMLGAGKPADFVIWASWQVKSRGLTDYLFSLDGRHPLAE